jgi:hypothetical protein
MGCVFNVFEGTSVQAESVSGKTWRVACKNWRRLREIRLAGVSLTQLLNRSVRFVNRDPDSGIRLLFEQLPAQQRLDGSTINGYERVEFTHAAVAAYMSSGTVSAWGRNSKRLFQSCRDTD